MNLFGFNISWNGNGKKKYVIQDDCHRSMDGLHHRITELDDHIGRRIEDLKDFLLKNGKS